MGRRQSWSSMFRQIEMQQRRDERWRRQQETWARRDRDYAERESARKQAEAHAEADRIEYEQRMNAWRNTPPVPDRIACQQKAKPIAYCFSTPPVLDSDAGFAALEAELVAADRNALGFFGRIFDAFTHESSSRGRAAAEAEWPQRWAQLNREHEESYAAWFEREERLRADHEASEARRIAPWRRLLDGDREQATRVVITALSGMDFPFDTTAAAAVDADLSVRILLDLPEIEDVVPEVKIEALKSGTVKKRKRTAVERNGDWADIAIGLGYAMAATALTASLASSRAFVAAYTQRRKPRSGKLVEEFVYEIEFDRDRLARANFARIDPSEDMKRFPARIFVGSNRMLGAIDPPDWPHLTDDDPS